MTDNSFNDDELANIMSEIESLESQSSAEEGDHDGVPGQELEQEVIEFSEDMARDLEALEAEASQHLDDIDQMVSETQLQENVESSAEEINPEEINPEEINPEEINPEEVNPEEVNPEEVNNVVPFNSQHSFKKDQEILEQGAAQANATASSGDTLISGDSPVKMNFEIAGQMEMNLSFVVGGVPVGLSISEQRGLIITLESGATFSIPFSSTKHKKVS